MAGSLALANAHDGGAVAWIVPTYRNARPVWRFIEQHAAQHAALKRAEMSAQFKGGHVTIYTADNDVSIRGETFDLVVIDEAARIKEETWADVVLPTLADRDGRVMLISTPRGHNWFWKEYERGRADGNQQASFTAPTSANPMPTIRRAFELARQRVSDRTFRQEWLAEFVADGAGVFRDVRALSIVLPEAPQSGRSYIIGRDWGRTNDPSVSSVWDALTKREVLLDIESNIPFALQLERLKALAERYNRALVIAEQNSLGDPLIEQASLAGINVRPFVTTNATKAAAVDNLALACERGAVQFQADDSGVQEMLAFESSKTASGMVRYSAPSGMHDDIVMARIIAYSGLSETESYGEISYAAPYQFSASPY